MSVSRMIGIINKMKNNYIEIVYLFSIVVLGVFVRIICMQFMPEYPLLDNATYQRAANDFLTTGVINNHYIG